MGLVYGIDFGTSNSAIMVAPSGGEPMPVANPFESGYEIPSVVCLRADGTMAVGSIAQRMRLQRAAWFRDEFKREVGRETPITFPPERRGDLAGTRNYPVHHLVAEVLSKLRQQAEEEVTGALPDTVVITVPASWEAGSKDQMLVAAAAAGFDSSTVHLVTEPEAAAAYAVRKHLGQEQRTLLIYDLGGGTFDCAVVRGESRLSFKVLGEVGGLDYIGGALFNRRILALICERFPQETARILDVDEPDYETLARRVQLRDTCENVKRLLSAEDHYDCLLPELGPDIVLALTRGELASRIAPLLAETIAECERLLTSVDLKWSDIDAVIPVGGSTRLPMVGEALARRCGGAGASVLRVDDPQLAVAHGAVLHGFDLQPTVQPLSADRAEPAAPRRATASAASSSRVPRDTPSAKQVLRSSYAPADAAPTRPRTGGARPSIPRTPAFSRARRISAAALWLIFAAVVLALLNIFSVVTATNPHHGVTRLEMEVAAYSVTGMAVCALAWSSRVMNGGRVPGAGYMLASSIVVALVAISHYFLHGWLGILCVVIFSAAACVCASLAYDPTI